MEGITQFYILFLSLAYVSQHSVSVYTQLTYHICIMATFLWLHTFMAIFGQFLAINSEATPALHWTDYTSMGLVTSLLLAISTIPTTPPLHQDATKIYTKDVAKKLEAMGNNLIPNLLHSHTSILGILFFGYIFPTIRNSANMDQVDVQDLPVLDSCMRAEPILLEHMQPFAKSSAFRAQTPLQLIWALWRPHLRWFGAGKF